MSDALEARVQFLKEALQGAKVVIRVLRTEVNRRLVQTNDLEHELADALNLLHDLEFSSQTDGGDQCPSCGVEGHPHEYECALAKKIGAPRKLTPRPVQFDGAYTGPVQVIREWQYHWNKPLWFVMGQSISPEGVTYWGKILFVANDKAVADKWVADRGLTATPEDK